MIKAFIAHASSDDAFVNWLKGRLQREDWGLDIFVDHDSNLPGDDAQNMIEEVKKSIIFIPVLSNVSVDRPFFKGEIRTAHNSLITNVFPIKRSCDDAKIPPGIKIEVLEDGGVQGKIWADFSNENEWPLQYQKLINAMLN